MRLARLVISALALGCAGDDDGTSPGSTPNVAGRYRAIRSLAAVACTPQQPPVAGGTVILAAFVDTVVTRIQQSGARLTLTYPDTPGSPADTGSVAHNGTVTIGYRDSFQEAPRQGNRTFFVDLTVTEQMQRTSDGGRLVGSGTYVNVFREGSATAAVFATCSRTATVELTRLGS
jgi:hypothetical protein